MLVGHLGVAMLAKQVEPRLSLGTALVASLLPDALLFSLTLAGTETVAFRTSTAPAAYLTVGDVALSHSLATLLLLAAGMVGVYRWRHGRAAGAWLLGALLIGHWVLDLVSYEPFLPLVPGREIGIGWSLTHRFALSASVEAVLWIGAVVLYVGDSRSVDSAGRYVFWGGVVSWTYIAWANVAGPPRNPADAPIEMLILLGMICGWGYWMNRSRAMKSMRAASVQAA